MSKLITMVLSYYNQSSMLKKHLLLWKSYSDIVKKHVEFIIVDDYSKKNPAQQTIEQFVVDTKLDIKLYRIMDDIFFNVSGAMNLGSREASANWILHMDMDHTLCNKNMEYLLQMVQNLKSNDYQKVFKFNRNIRSDPTLLARNPTGFKRHPKLCLISKKCFWNIGGIDEDFAGHYGLDDTSFFIRGKGKYQMVYLDHVLLDMDMDGDSGVNRDISYNTVLLENKKTHGNWSGVVLRFKWGRVI
jgi:hypothetical protein